VITSNIVVMSLQNQRTIGNFQKKYKNIKLGTHKNADILLLKHVINRRKLCDNFKHSYVFTESKNNR